MLNHTSRIKLTPYVFITPFLLFFGVFRFAPIIITFLTSFNTPTGDINFYLYSKVFTDPIFYKSIGNTLVILCFYLLIILPIVIFVSVQINKSRFKQVIIALMLIPTFVGMFAYAIIFRYMFTYNGVINNFLEYIIQMKIDWFGVPIFAQLMMAIALSWTGIGYFVLMYTNGLRSIPTYYYDALKLETKSRFKTFLYVQLPMTIPVIKSIIFFAVIELFALIDLPLNLTQGAPKQATITLSYYIYQQGLEYFDFAYAATMSVVVLCVFLTVFSVFKPEKEGYYEMV